MENTARDEKPPPQDKPHGVKAKVKAEAEADTIIRSAQQLPALKAPLLRQHYTQVASSLRITAEILGILSGNKHKVPERIAASTIGIVTSLLGIVFKQQPQLKEELDKLSRMSTGEYIALRLQQSLDPQKHIRQTLAAGMMAACISGMMAAVRSKRYGEGIGAALGFLGACILSFTKDDRKAWEIQSIAMTALATPNHIFYGAEAAFKHHDMLIPASMALQTVANGLTFVETYGRKKDAAQPQEDKSR